MTAITLKLPEALADLVAAEAQRRHATRSQVVRSCIEDALRNPRRPAKGSFHDQASDLCGICRDAPPGLSSDPRHLEAYGQ